MCWQIFHCWLFNGKETHVAKKLPVADIICVSLTMLSSSLATYRTPVGCGVYGLHYIISRFQLPRGLRRGPTAVPLLGLRVRIPPGASRHFRNSLCDCCCWLSVRICILKHTDASFLQPRPLIQLRSRHGPPLTLGFRLLSFLKGALLTNVQKMPVNVLRITRVQPEDVFSIVCAY